jgi:hypothetical protein
MCMSAALAGGAVVGSLVSAYGQNQAAKKQAKAGRAANSLLDQGFETSKGYYEPYSKLGTDFTNTLVGKDFLDLGGDPANSRLLRQFNPTVAELEGTPGYQFLLDQGMKGVQNSYAAKGLGSSGAAMKGATEFATGLAMDKAFMPSYTMFRDQQDSAYNKLMGGVGIGQNAANSLAGLTMNTNTAKGNNLIGIGNAQAGAIAGGANAIGQGLAQAGNMYAQAPFFENMLLQQKQLMSQRPGGG